MTAIALLVAIICLPLTSGQDPLLWQRAEERVHLRLHKQASEAARTVERWNEALCEAAGLDRRCEVRMEVYEYVEEPISLKVDEETIRSAMRSVTKAAAAPIPALPSGITGTCETDLYFLVSSSIEC